ncbi:uncharacterized protein MONOS_9958 [Monocercomonoides exilis]|uniref:uncharacterized protein n=1 Tax=Monocercomonoides exilis TaxID=2049356 RepID=UPI0035597B93|nr:hypothetical protein MONOS_9958 [Monocercomonoides exilis]|eukprot:MONOS_9958.1-p1 / transcript=MONOS_9958.1 / gene=MONOS_9958 / organism=Monocercomonoides_exilis_PA203 / gene_product=unspecified product / transcript_product=unspecified product / location=Mono_scaffold00431:37295-38329(-) / protein_length=345 / sequence_SO=supercontig / SO=protein_coding / is_pseudo=false
MMAGLFILNNPLASLTASNTSFIGCCRTRDVECTGTADRKMTPGRQNTTDNGANTFTWCEWSGSRTTGESGSWSDGMSSGGAICMYNLNSGELSVSHCSFNGCAAYYHGGAVMCHAIKTIKMVSNVFNSCTAQNYGGGGVYACEIRSCALVSGCDFQNCKAHHDGGGLRLVNFQVSGSRCIGEEDGEGRSSCVFDCNFTLCFVENANGGGMFCKTVHATQFKMRSIQFPSCTASTKGGGLFFSPWKEVLLSDKLYFFFLFFHDCSCLSDPSYGDDIHYEDRYNLYLGSGNPFYECYTTNTDEKRVCYGHDYSSSTGWTFQHTEKKEWLKRGIHNRFVAVSGGCE